jgi:hypothetical protein
MGLALLAHASMPLKYWDEVFLAAIFLINRTRTKLLSYDTPLHKLLGATPDYSSFRVFGCACWPNLRPYNSHKLELDPPAVYFLGYSNLHKGFKCLDISKGRIYIYRDVIFDENIFPFATLNPNAGARYHSDVLLLPSTDPRNNVVTNLTNDPTMPVLPVFVFSVQQQQDVRCMPLYHVHHKYALCPHRSLRQLLCRSTPGAYLLVSCGSQWLMLSVTRLHLRCDPSRCLALMPSGVPCSLSPLPTRAGRLRSACHSSAMSCLHRSRLAAPLPDQHRAARMGPLRHHRIQCCPQLLKAKAIYR